MSLELQLTYTSYNGQNLNSPAVSVIRGSAVVCIGGVSHAAAVTLTACLGSAFVWSFCTVVAQFWGITKTYHWFQLYDPGRTIWTRRNLVGLHRTYVFIVGVTTAEQAASVLMQQRRRSLCGEYSGCEKYVLHFEFFNLETVLRRTCIRLFCSTLMS